MNITLYIFGSVFLVSLVSFVGVLGISQKAERLGRLHSFLIPLAVGALFGDAFFHLIPESFEEAKNPSTVSFIILLGIISFFILEKILRLHHHGVPEDSAAPGKNKKYLGHMILISDGLHNFLDGVIIGVSYLANIEIGIATTIAVILHEIPEEIADFGILIYSGYKKSAALFYNFLSALTAIIGAVLVVLFGQALESFARSMIPLAAGVFIYIAGSDLVPELHKNCKAKTALLEIAAILIGVIAMYLLLFLE